MAEFRRGAEAIEQAAQRQGSGKFMPVFKFEAGDTKYVQILMAIDEVPTVLMHQFIIVGQREDGTPMYERFISRRDPALDGADGYDDLIDRFGLNPSNRSIALAVEVEPVYGSGTSKRKTITGFDLAERQFERDGETVTVPAFGLIIESPNIFFTHLAANADIKAIEESIWAVKRTGKSTDTTYTFIDTGQEALDVDEELEEFSERFDFDEYLDMLADEDRMRELIGELPDNAKVSMFDKKKGKGGSKQEDEKPARGSRRRAVARAEEPAEERDFQTEDEEEEGEQKKAAPSRSRRFAGLRDEAKKNKVEA